MIERMAQSTVPEVQRAVQQWHERMQDIARLLSQQPGYTQALGCEFSNAILNMLESVEEAFGEGMRTGTHLAVQGVVSELAQNLQGEVESAYDEQEQVRNRTLPCFSSLSSEVQRHLVLQAYVEKERMRVNLRAMNIALGQTVLMHDRIVRSVPSQERE